MRCKKSRISLKVRKQVPLKNRSVDDKYLQPNIFVISQPVSPCPYKTLDFQSQRFLICSISQSVTDSQVKSKSDATHIDAQTVKRDSGSKESTHLLVFMSTRWERTSDFSDMFVRQDE